MDRREAVQKIGLVPLALPLAYCGENRTNLADMVRETKEGLLLDYEIIPADSAERGANRFANYPFTRHGGGRLYTPDLDDERWLEHYKILREQFSNPIDAFKLEDIEPMFGMHARRVHPTTLEPRYYHTAVDIFRDVGTDIFAAHDGFVELNKDSEGGNWVKLIHPIRTRDGYHLETRYLHLDNFAPNIQNGTRVVQTQPIGKLGGTGIMRGFFPHLHFEIVMVNNQRPQFSLVLDPARIYFDPQIDTGFLGIGLFAPSQNTYFRSRTSDITDPDVVEKLAQRINELPSQEKRLLPEYIAYWKNASQKDQRFRDLLDRLQ